MYQFKQGSPGKIMIGIGDATTGVGVTGLSNSANTFKLKKPGAAAAAKTFTGGEWVEIGNGWYEAALAAGDVDTLGECLLVVIPSSGPEGGYPFQVVANTAADVAGAIAAVETKVDTIDGIVDAILTRTDVATSTRLASGTVAADVAAMVASLSRVRALVGDNVVTDTIVDPGTGATSIRERGYDSAANADAAYASSPAGGATGLLYTITFEATYAGSDLTKAKRTVA